MSDKQSFTETSATQAASIASPINLILFSLLILLAYFRLRGSPPQILPKGPEPIVFRTTPKHFFRLQVQRDGNQSANNLTGKFTPPTLKPYNGEHNMPVYLAVRGKVFDVTPGRNFYGPGGPYENFAGRDATRGLACGSFDEEMLTKDLNGPLDDLSGLGDAEMEALQGWEERFNEKYLIVGELVPVSEGPKE